MQTNFAGNHATVAHGSATGHSIPDKLITDTEMAETIGCGRSTVWKWVADGILPKPLKIGGMSRWKLSDAYDVIKRAEAEREAA